MNTHTRLQLPPAWRQENGYTLVETLVAMSLLLIVMIPVSKIISQVIADHRAEHKVIAANLAEKTMENRLIAPIESVGSNEYSEQIAGQLYRIRETIDVDRNLWRITVRVFRKQSTEPLVELYCYQLRRDE